LSAAISAILPRVVRVAEAMVERDRQLGSHTGVPGRQSSVGRQPGPGDPAVLKAAPGLSLHQSPRAVLIRIALDFIFAGPGVDRALRLRGELRVTGSASLRAVAAKSTLEAQRLLRAGLGAGSQ
jgi:hypothetical protein